MMIFQTWDNEVYLYGISNLPGMAACMKEICQYIESLTEKTAHAMGRHKFLAVSTMESTKQFVQLDKNILIILMSHRETHRGFCNKILLRYYYF